MFELTEKAGEMIKETFKYRQDIPTIRIESAGGG